jgi:predicted unusual protein kinase regulating ubiquinone biosynthesis (AarF/ABC1/UbiB family)
MIIHRYRRIVVFFAWVIAGFAFWDILLPRLGLGNLARRTRPERLRNTARAFRGLAVDMGGVLIKVGQFLSSRVDVLPAQITDELAGLQDEVPPEDFKDILRVAEEELGGTLEQKFSFFDEIPLAAASLGQVHRARICSDGGNSGSRFDSVVVKVQRPNIEQVIDTDLAALRTVGNWLKRYRPISRRADIPALMEEFSRILYEEIDYLAEGRNAEIFADHFSSIEGVRVPGVVWSHTSKRLLTLEDVYAIKISDYEAITSSGVKRSQVASRLIDTYLKQVFEDGFFHADPHPGNLFVYPLPEENGSPDSGETVNGRPWLLTFVDFGMVGRIPRDTVEGLRDLLIAVGTKDAHRVVQAYERLGILLPSADTDMLEKAEAKMFDRFWGKSMGELQQIDTQEIREFLEEFREILFSMPFQVPQDLIYLVRAVGILSGMATGLDPEFNVWHHLAPYAEKLIYEEGLMQGDFWFSELRNYLGTLLALPSRLNRSLDKIERGEVVVRSPDVVERVERMERGVRQLAGSVIFIGFLMGGVQLVLNGFDLPGWGLLAGAGISLFWLAFLSGR